MKKIYFTIFFSLLTFYFVFNFNPVVTSNATATKFSIQKTTAYAHTFGQPTDLTKWLSNPSAYGDSKWTYQVYQVTRALFNVAALIALFMYAFANILHINVETYAIKKILPKLIVAVLVVNLAFPMFAILSRFVDSLEGVKMFQPLGSSWWGYLFNMKTFISSLGLSAVTLALSAIFATVFNIIGLGIAVLILFGSTILKILLSMLLSFRPTIILIGIAVLPLALAASLFPQTEEMFKKWVKIMTVWMFLNIIINFILQLTMKIP